MEERKDEAVISEGLDFYLRCPVCGCADSYGFTGYLGLEGCSKHRLFWKEQLTKAYLNSRCKDRPDSNRPGVATGHLRNFSENSQRAVNH